MQRTVRLAALAIGLCLTAACGRSSAPVVPQAHPTSQAGLPTGVLTITTDGSQAVLSVEIADTEATRETGLMGRTDLAPDSGMVFLFEDPFQGGFWMKDTLIPLSIAFWDADGRIVDIRDMQPCEKADTNTCPVYGSQKPYVGTVETNLGYFAEHGVKVGDTVELER